MCQEMKGALKPVHHETRDCLLSRTWREDFERCGLSDEPGNSQRQRQIVNKRKGIVPAVNNAMLSSLYRKVSPPKDFSRIKSPIDMPTTHPHSVVIDVVGQSPSSAGMEWTVSIFK
jgi:hypothetical protein